MPHPLPPAMLLPLLLPCGFIFFVRCTSHGRFVGWALLFLQDTSPIRAHYRGAFSTDSALLPVLHMAIYLLRSTRTAGLVPFGAHRALLPARNSAFRLPCCLFTLVWFYLYLDKRFCSVCGLRLRPLDRWDGW